MTPPKPLEIILVLKKLKRKKKLKCTRLQNGISKKILSKTAGKKVTSAKHYAPTTLLRHFTEVDTFNLITTLEVGTVISISSMGRANSER